MLKKVCFLGNLLLLLWTLVLTLSLNKWSNYTLNYCNKSLFLSFTAFEIIAKLVWATAVNSVVQNIDHD